jgi:hypothetical protein
LTQVKFGAKPLVGSGHSLTHWPVGRKANIPDELLQIDSQYRVSVFAKKPGGQARRQVAFPS